MQPTVKKDYFAMCESCLMYVQLLPPDKKGDRYSPLRLDPLQLQNNKEFRFDEAKPKVADTEAAKTETNYTSSST